MDIDRLPRWRVTPVNGRARTFRKRDDAAAHAASAGGKITEFAVWQVRYKDPDGAQRSKDHATKVDAERWATTTGADLIRGQYLDPKAGRVKFRDYAEALRKIKTHAPKTAEKVEADLTNHIYPVLGDFELGGPKRIRHTQIQGWVKGVEGKLAPSTIEVVYSRITMVFKAAILDGLRFDNPCTGVELPDVDDHQVTPWPDEWVQTLMPAALERRYSAIVPYAAMTGVRQGELFGLTLSQLRMLKAEVDVDWQLQHLKGIGVVLCRPKSKSSRRTIPLPKPAVDALAAHMAEFPPVTVEIGHRERDGTTKVYEEQLVFTSATGRPLRKNTFDEKVWKPALLAAGIADGVRKGDRGMHQLRHWYASTLIAQGVDLNIVKERMGHWSIQETVDTYGHLQVTADDRTRQAFGHLFKGPGGEEIEGRGGQG